MKVSKHRDQFQAHHKAIADGIDQVLHWGDNGMPLADRDLPCLFATLGAVTKLEVILNNFQKEISQTKINIYEYIKSLEEKQSV